MRRPCLPSLRAAIGIALAALAGSAWAHDTWFAPVAATKPGEIQLMLGTGNQYPIQESALAFEHVEKTGCRAADGKAVTMASVRTDPTALVLRARLDAQAQPVTCWAQLVPFDIQIADDKVELYLKEIQASPAIRERWDAQRARGVKWTERYTKHARIELPGPAPAAEAKPEPVPAKALELGMDALLEPSTVPIVAGDTVRFRVLRDGKPLADFPVELRSERANVGLWLKTDAQGRVSSRVPIPGRWVLRGVDLHPSESLPDAWESRFVTLVFEAEPKQAAGASGSRKAAP